MSYVEASTAARSLGESLAPSGLVSALDALPAKSFFGFLPELPMVWERAPGPGKRKAKPWEALLHNLLFVYSSNGKGTFSAQSLLAHPAQSAKSSSWLRKTLGCLKGSKWFLTRHPLSPHTAQTSQGTHYYWKGRNRLSNLGHNNGCKMDSLRTHWPAWTNKSSQQGVSPWSQSVKLLRVHKILSGVSESMSPSYFKCLGFSWGWGCPVNSDGGGWLIAEGGIHGSFVGLSCRHSTRNSPTMAPSSPGKTTAEREMVYAQISARCSAKDSRHEGWAVNGR